MRDIIRGREVVPDSWRYAGDAGSGPEVLSLDALLAAVALDSAPAAGAGVSLQPTDEPEKLAALLPRLALIVLEFPKVGEGRGFSQAQLLRQRYGYRGELRARGALKRDQLFFLARCGFDSFDLDPGENLAASLAAFDTFSAAYQPGAGGGLPLRSRQTG
jgi:uncharacterized protein (DUF934 family)